MSASEFTILLFYKYTPVSEPEALAKAIRKQCQELDVKGRIIIANEGINATVEGKTEQVMEFFTWLSSIEGFDNIHLKKSPGTGTAFPKLSVKVRTEIVSTHLEPQADVNPLETTGKYLDPEELYQWFEQGKEFYIVDMRNDYEQRVGYFQNSLLSEFGHFRDLPTILPQIEHLKHKTILSVCTGGIRCEKASGFLVKHGFTDVYQLHGGIVSFMEKYPNTYFLGKLYVFDNRLMMGFNTDSPEHMIVGTCEKCGKTSEEFLNCGYDECSRHFICCKDCRDEHGKSFCDESCHQGYLKRQELLAKKSKSRVKA